MAKAAQKITLSPSRDIPFDKLVLSQSNVRRIKAGVSVEELAEDIARRGLLQSLNVRPVLDADGVETGTFEIPAGGRRFQALSLLVKQKRLAKAAPIPCIVRDAASGILAEDDSLAENMQRVALHPLDQFRAFQALREKGQSEEEIAAAFFVTPQIVKQRLKLASVAPALLEVYAEDGMTLEQLMAFTVNPDHARQAEVWDAVKNSWNKEPYAIRRMLTETSVRASDRRAVFVGVDAYEAAGGVVLRDLFQGDDGGWLEDPALLDRLVSEKLQAEAEALASEGWKWIEVATDLPYGYSHGLRRLAGDSSPMTDEESAAHASFLAEYRALEEKYSSQDEYPEEVDARLGQLETAMEALEQRPLVYEPAEVVLAGVFVTLDRDGILEARDILGRYLSQNSVIGSWQALMDYCAFSVRGPIERFHVLYRRHSMTLTEPTLAPPMAPSTIDMAQTFAAHAARAARIEALRPGNKDRLFDGLMAAGITHVTVTFDGAGDSGQIESIGAWSGETAVEFPATEIDYAALTWDSPEVEVRQLSLEDVVEQLAYDFLSDTHVGWENNDGAYGEFCFDASARCIHLDFNERFTSSELYTHDF